jgi:hypothetical protein
MERRAGEGGAVSGDSEMSCDSDGAAPDIKEGVSPKSGASVKRVAQVS